VPVPFLLFFKYLKKRILRKRCELINISENITNVSYLSIRFSLQAD